MCARTGVLEGLEKVGLLVEIESRKEVGVLIECRLGAGAVFVPLMAPKLETIAARACQCGPVVLHCLL